MKKSVQEVDIHNHTCLIYNNQAELFQSLIPFISEGLNRNQKGFIVTSDIVTGSEILKGIELIYTEIVKRLKKPNLLRSITIESFKNVYLKNDLFNMEAAGKYYLSQVEEALKEGFSGLRVFAELSSSLKTLVNPKDFLQWEEEADKVFPKTKFCAVCAYDKRLFSNEYIQEAINIHPIEVMNI